MSESSNEVSAGEVYRGLEAIRGDIRDVKKAVETRPDWEDVKRVERGLEAQVKAEAQARAAERLVADKAIKSLQEWNSWAVRLLLGTAATGIVVWIVDRTLEAL